MPGERRVGICGPTDGSGASHRVVNSCRPHVEWLVKTSCGMQRVENGAGAEHVVLVRYEQWSRSKHNVFRWCRNELSQTLCRYRYLSSAECEMKQGNGNGTEVNRRGRLNRKQ